MGKLERDYQASLIRKLKIMFPDCMVLKNDSSYIQGIPDLMVLFNDKWAALEVKSSPDSNIQPNQEYYINGMNNMSFAAFIYPQNEEEVLYALQLAFKVRRPSRVFKS